MQVDMKIKYHGIFKTAFWKPARWWCPERCYFRFIITVSVPRRWWPHWEDGVRTCYYCKEETWMLSRPNMLCPACAKLLKQLGNMIDGPSWWLDTLKREAKKHWRF